MSLLPPTLEDLTAELGRLPKVGPKSAQQLAFFCANLEPERMERLLGMLRRASTDLHPCSRCFFVADDELCRVCSNPKRDPAVLAVVEHENDVIALEQSGDFQGHYFVLGASLSPLDGVGPENINFAELMTRLREGVVKEVILALDPDVEGELTATFLGEQLRPLGLKVTRLAYGLPAGGGVAFADSVTVARALAGRRDVNEILR